jgi:hypothetical protein
MEVEKTFKLDEKISAWRNLSQGDLLAVSLGAFIIWKIVEVIVAEMLWRYIGIGIGIYGWYCLYTFIAELLPPNIVENFFLFNGQGDQYCVGRDTVYIPLVVKEVKQEVAESNHKYVDVPRTALSTVNA